MNRVVKRFERFLVSYKFNLWKIGLILILASISLGGCAQTRTLIQSENLTHIPKQSRVILMPLDIELSELTASGALEPNAEWTELARANVSAALKAELADKGDVLITYRQPKDEKTEHLHQQLIKLHSVVGLTIIKHKLLPDRIFELPTKVDKFDWTLGPATADIRQDNADYGLFVHIRDSYTSAGRAALIVAAAIFRVGVSGGRTLAFASLVDLRTGNIVWFNLLGSASANLRTEEPARDAVKELLTDLPL